jgi:hypothetical protein
MTGPGQPAAADSFGELMAEVMASAHRFGHREHVHLTWLAVRRHGVPPAIGLVSDGIRRTARYAGAPQKYHATVSRAWVELTRHYTSAALASTPARTGWIEPDLAPFPWPSRCLPEPSSD